MADPRRSRVPKDAASRLHVGGRACLVGAGALTIGALALLLPASTTTATTLSTAEAQAGKISQQITSVGKQIDALSQQFDAAQEQYSQINQQITNTQTQIANTQVSIQKDRSTVKVAAVNAYVTAGSTSSSGPFLGQSESKQVDTKEYDQFVTGNLAASVSDLSNLLVTLTSQEQSLHSEQVASGQALAASRAAFGQAQTLEAQLKHIYANETKQVALLISQYKAAGEAAAAAAALAQLNASGYNGPAPPPAPNGEGTKAVAAAESQLGVPYIYGAVSPGHGFDCSGLTSWAWGQAGVYLPHYSGSQFQDSVPVPLSDLLPGDLLFYGYNGSRHVAMYIGGGQMIEALHYGTVVRIDPVRLGTDFAGAGRP